MPLGKQIYSVPFSSGIDTKNDERLVPDGKLLELENGIFTKGGSIKKRRGFTQLTIETNTTTQISSGKYLSSYNDEVLLFDNTNMYSWDENADKWADKGFIPSLAVTSENIIRNDSSSQTLADSAYVNGYVLYAWQDSRSTNSIRYSVIDYNTGNFIISDTSVATTGFEPKLAVVGNKVIILYRNGTGLRFKVFDSASPTTLSTETTISGITLSTSVTHSLYLYDLVNYSSSAAALMWYGSYTSISTSPILGLFKTDGTFLVGPTQHSALSSVQSIAIETDGTYIYTYATDDSDPTFQLKKWDSSLASAATPVNLFAFSILATRSMIAIDNTNSFVYVIENLISGPTVQLIRTTTSLTGAASVGTIGKSYTVHKPFLYNGKIYYGVRHSSTLQSSYYLYSQSASAENSLITKINANNGEVFANTHHTAKIINPATNVYLWPSIIRNRIESNSNTFFFTTGVNSVTYNMSNTVKFTSATIANNLLISSGMLWEYDGAGIFENGFTLFPEDITTANAGAGSVADGTYLYKAVYEWTDNKGNRHKSAPSPSKSHTVTGGPRAVTVTIPSIVHTRKKSPRQDVSIIVYRTVAGGSTTFYRLTSLTSPTANNSAGTAATFSDTSADASITSNEILYTVGGEVENIAPPANSYVVTGNNRAYVAGLENSNEFWFSKEVIPGESVDFSDLLTKRVDPIGGPITGLSYLDGKLIIFKEGRILVMGGDGPLSTGQQDAFTVPQLITADVGCDNANSIIVMDKGVMFHSKKGIYLLDRSLAAQYIGAPVESFNAYTITSAVVLPTDNEVRFSTSNGTTIVYNYFFDQWSTFPNQTAIGQTIWQNNYCWLRDNGQLYKESTAFTDVGNSYSLKLTTAWIKAQQIQGFKRIWRMALLGEFRSTHSFKVRIAYDYNPAYVEEFTLTTDGMGVTFYGDSSPYGDESPYGGSTDSVFQLRSRLSRQKCESIKFEFSDILGTSTGESYLLNELALEVGHKGQLMKLPARKTGGI